MVGSNKMACCCVLHLFNYTYMYIVRCTMYDVRCKSIFGQSSKSSWYISIVLLLGIHTSCMNFLYLQMWHLKLFAQTTQSMTLWQSWDFDQLCLLPVHVNVAVVLELLGKLLGKSGMCAGWEVAESICHCQTTFLIAKN